MTGRIELASEAKCCGLCASKEIVIEALFITTITKTCCETTENVIPLAEVDDVTIAQPKCCAFFCKCLTCGTVCRAGKLRFCDCSCKNNVLYVNYGSGRSICIEKIDEPEQIFEQLKQRLHVAKGGPVRAQM